MLAVRFLVCICLVLLPLAVAAADAPRVRVATTTSLDNSGLLEYLRADLQAACACELAVIPVGSGKALAMGRRGDADLLITHAPAAEAAFMNEGYGIDYYPIAYNHFVILSPSESEIKQKPPLDLLREIAESQKRFISRGDDSGTHKMEQRLWEQVQAGQGGRIDFIQPWYISAGIGMAQAIVMADELRGFVLSDRGTYLFLEDKVDLKIVSQDSDATKNVYSVMRLNPQRFPNIADDESAAAKAARAAIQWLRSDEAQAKIAAYRVWATPLFYPITAAP